MIRLPRKTTLTILAFCGYLGLAEVVPVLHNYKVMDWRSVPRVLDFVERRQSAAPLEAEQARLRPDTDPIKQARFPIIDQRRELDRFYAALHRAEGRERGAVARVLHYGDSPTTADMITSDVRRLLQGQFGDAGHGFCLLAKPWAWYSHQGVEITSSGWVIDPANQSTVQDGLYGIGGVSFRGGAGSLATIRVRDRSHSAVEIAYWRQPGGGQLRVFAGSEDLGVVETNASAASSGFAHFELPKDTATITVQAMSGPVRLFGFHLERNQPGVRYNSLGVNGAYISVLAKFFNETHWSDQLRHYSPDLVIVNYGTNESMYASFVDKASEKELQDVVRRLRKAVPRAAILIMSPMDRGQRMARGEIGTVPTIPRLVAIQQRVAQDTGVAFFNTFEAMGGLGTMGRWYEAEPRLVGADFIHPMPGGARIVGGLLYQALLDGYNRYKLRLIREKLMMAGR
jgi:lysophospholipase L1-like esterase